MKKVLAGLIGLLVVLIVWTALGGRHPASPGPIHLLATIQVPGNPLKAFDISWVDAASGRYYLADRSNAAVDMVNTRDNSFIGRVNGFTGDDKRGHDYGGPNGVVAAGSLVWAGDGNSNLQAIDLNANPPHIIKTIATGGKLRVDELAYDEKDQIILAANNADSPPFITLVSAKTLTSLGRVTFPEANGIEQSVWNPATGHFLVTVPLTHGFARQVWEIVAGDGVAGEIAELDPTRMSVIGTIATHGCLGSGLALGPNGRLLQGCFRWNRSLIVDTASTDTTIVDKVGGSDEVWFNPGDRRHYLGAGFNHGGPVLGVIDANSGRWIQNVATTSGAHSVAADSTNNHIFVPLTPNQMSFDNDPARGLDCAHGCIGVYGEH